MSSSVTPSSSDLETTSPGPLQSDLGKTTVADRVVQKIVGLAAREVPGIYDLGGGAARTLAGIRERIPGSSQASGQGVSVEVGETQAAVDLEVVTEYGMSIADVAKSVRRNVISAVEGMTGLQVTEVNLAVNDIHLPGDEQEDPAQPARVQ
ncbi:MAG TPA: Asp23/Gls24 family envelope stress response protein [Propionibacteriaceae bacterium]|nr:Asp23/Gls24 family envelope stress response protein [Propionibacteriaceae bacterium]